MPRIEDIDNILRSGPATSATPGMIGRDVQTFAPTVENIDNILRSQTSNIPIQQDQQIQQTRPEIIQGGIQQAEQGNFVPESRLGFFTAPDVFARKIASGEIKKTERSVIDNATQHIQLLTRLSEEEVDPVKKERKLNNLSEFIQRTNNLLQDDIFQLPSNLQVAAAIGETALDFAPVPAFGLLKGARIGTRLGFEAAEQGAKVVERGALRVPTTLGRTAINQSILGGTLGGVGGTLAGIQQTDSISEGLKQGAIGAPLGAAFGVVLPLTGRLLQPVREAILRPQEIKNKPLRWVMQKALSPIKNVVSSAGKSGDRLTTLGEAARIEGQKLSGQVLIGREKFRPIYNTLSESEKTDFFNILAKESNFGLSPDEVIIKEGITDQNMINSIKSFFQDITFPLSYIASKTGSEYRGGATVLEGGLPRKEIVRRAGKPGVFIPRILDDETRQALIDTGVDRAIKNIADNDPRLQKITDADKKLIKAREMFNAMTSQEQLALRSGKARTITLNSMADYKAAGLETDIFKIIDSMADRDAMLLGLQKVMSDTKNPLVKELISEISEKAEVIVSKSGDLKLPKGDISYNDVEDIISNFGVPRLTARKIVNTLQKDIGVKTAEDSSLLLIKNKKNAQILLNKEIKKLKLPVRVEVTKTPDINSFLALPAHEKVNKILKVLYDGIEQETSKKFNEAEAKILGRMSRDYINKQFHSLPFDESGITSFFKQLNAAKLSTSFVANSTQLLATLLATDLPTLSKAIKATVTSIDARQLPKRAGIIQDTSLRKEAGSVFFKGYQRFLDVLLAPFKWTENNINRAVTGNAGAFYASKLLKYGKVDELSKILSRSKISDAIKRGYLVEDDLLEAAGKMVNKTQFGFNPVEYPELFSTPWGSVILQFKSFIYRQMLLVLDETAGEFAAGRAGRAQRNMMIILTAYPAAGHVIKSFNNFIAGKPTDIDEMNIARYFEDISSVGALGIGTEFLESLSTKNALNFLAGPTIGGGVQSIQNIISKGLDPEGLTDSIIKESTAQFGGAGRFLGRKLTE